MASMILVGLMMATLLVLVAGVVLMGIGGKGNAKYSHGLMVARVSLQGLALLVLALLFASAKK